jgi:hypothetical protein
MIANLNNGHFNPKKVDLNETEIICISNVFLCIFLELAFVVAPGSGK